MILHKKMPLLFQYSIIVNLCNYSILQLRVLINAGISHVAQFLLHEKSKITKKSWLNASTSNQFFSSITLLSAVQNTVCLVCVVYIVFVNLSFSLSHMDLIFTSAYIIHIRLFTVQKCLMADYFWLKPNTLKEMQLCVIVCLSTFLF